MKIGIGLTVLIENWLMLVQMYLHLVLGVDLVWLYSAAWLGTPAVMTTL